MAHRPARSLAAAGILGLFVLLVSTGCLTVSGPPATALARIDHAVYQTVVDSLYRRGARDRKIGIVREPLDTSCAARTCLPLQSRWGLDSLSLRSANRPAAADEMRRELLVRIGRGYPIPTGAFDQVTHASILAAEIPHPGANAADWRAFHDAKGTAAIVRFTPVGFSKDRRSAVVVVQMQCGVGCGHMLALTLEADQSGRWRIDDMLRIGVP